MSNLATLPAAKPTAYASVSYRAFRIGRPRASEITLVRPATLDDAVEQAQVACLHREHFAVRETDDAGTRVHIFTIKRRSTPTWEWRGVEKVRVHDLYAEAVTVVPGAVFA